MVQFDPKDTNKDSFYHVVPIVLVATQVSLYLLHVCNPVNLGIYVFITTEVAYRAPI
jgi:hypothetical protein